tara:strand:+ start:328 stop:540 length:213 start_codon:yes stop_codon:yes gene_type:complete
MFSLRINFEVVDDSIVILGNKVEALKYLDIAQVMLTEAVADGMTEYATDLIQKLWHAQQVLGRTVIPFQL